MKLGFRNFLNVGVFVSSIFSSSIDSSKYSGLFEADDQFLPTSSGELNKRAQATGIALTFKSGNLGLTGSHPNSQLLLTETAALPGFLQLQRYLCFQHDGVDLGRQFGVCRNGIIDSLEQSLTCLYHILGDKQFMFVNSSLLHCVPPSMRPVSTAEVYVGQDRVPSWASFVSS